jgi:lipopolysaccharide transport system permease protein
MELLIKPKNKWWEFNWKELWAFRDLFYFFTWRDVKVKYKQTVIGVTWALFQPFMTMIVFSIFFGKFAAIPSEGIPYPIFVYTGLIFWTFFSSSLTHISDSFISNERILTKIYFPRIILPISSILTNFLDFIIAAILLLILMAYYHYFPSILGLVLIPVLLLMTVLSTFGLDFLFGFATIRL